MSTRQRGQKPQARINLPDGRQVIGWKEAQRLTGLSRAILYRRASERDGVWSIRATKPVGRPRKQASSFSERKPATTPLEYEALTLYVAGETLNTIYRRTGVTVDVLHRVRRQHGIPVRPAGRSRKQEA